MVLLSILSNASTHCLITEISYERREKERVETIQGKKERAGENETDPRKEKRAGKKKDF